LPSGKLTRHGQGGQLAADDAEWQVHPHAAALLAEGDTALDPRRHMETAARAEDQMRGSSTPNMTNLGARPGEGSTAKPGETQQSLRTHRSAAQLTIVWLAEAQAFKPGANPSHTMAPL